MSRFVCQQCGYSSPKWVGQCPQCQSWNSFEETVDVVAKKGRGSGGRGGGGGGSGASADSVESVSLADVARVAATESRMSTGLGEFDRVLGGGVVPGSVLLLGGEPGIGKSTLLTQFVINCLKNGNKDTRIFYICGEENPHQVALRVRRMTAGEGLIAGVQKRLIFLSTTDTDACTAMMERDKPGLVIVDSIQSMSTGDLTGAPGSIGQLKESTLRFTQTAKRLRIPVMLVGHVTKEGEIAGPKVLEHIVDTVLELSGERSGFFRLLRSIKNRFGATDEVGVFRVVERGLEEVPNPSAVFLEENTLGRPGSALACIVEGTRPLIIEIQALVVRSQLAIPRRVARGLSVPRIQLLAAVLQKHANLPLGEYDIFVNVAGGFTVHEPGADLAAAVAIASSFANTAFSNEAVYAAEIGLLGEIRTVSLLDQRIKEARRLGYKTVTTSKTTKSLSGLVRQLLGSKR